MATGQASKIRGTSNGCYPVDWVDFAFKGEKPEGSEEVGNYFDWVILFLPHSFSLAIIPIAL